ncbi:hypothetical protein [Nocardia cyriacigeorgica]|uniref:hypothetical protein n=1 Tax=Nocardia cyriacigeorgica TaxID=135487 RepID=UPI002455FCB9|nr:hypothetical protein [Nocardia cyriacigeorgica]BDT87995.1 hypothetical protein FMUAM8_37590 [Nocardia cyriacigeorgica]
MLKSYKQLNRWYGALEPETGSSAPARPAEESAPIADEDDGPARYPDYIPNEQPVAPPEPPVRRSEFTGGWSDWVADRAPGPDDDYTPRNGDVVRFPWPDDDPEEVAEPVRLGAARDLRTAGKSSGGGRARALVVLIATVLLLAAAAAGVLYLLGDSGERRAGDETAVQFTAGSFESTAGPAQRCPTERTDEVVRSAEAGGTDSGPDAILRFQYAYYVDRSAVLAREVVAPGAPVSPASVIQRGIDSIAAGTTHCVRIVTLDQGRYSVEVTEYRPDGQPATYSKQMVTTAVIGGRTLITGITAG